MPPQTSVARLRYGFIANFADGKDTDVVVRNFRRLHLTGAQFYDWAYRHADLVGPDATWSDPAGPARQSGHGTGTDG